MTTVGDAIETRENIPLQKGRKHANLCSYCSEDYLSGSKFINVAFATLTVIITVALLLQIYYGDYQVAPHGSVATDSLQCSKVGTSILKKGGNAVDATIASAFCLAVVTPHLTSLDGEGLLLIYNHRKRIVPEVIDFTSTSNSTEHLLPRLVLGLAFLHEQYSTISWKELVQPAADLARQGFLIPKMLIQAIARAQVHFYGHLEAGQLLQLEPLATTLEQIADIPEKELYQFVKNGGRQPIYSQALKLTFNNYDVYVPGGPSIGPLFLANLQRLDKFNFTKGDAGKTEYKYRVAEVTQNFYDDLNVSSRFHQGTSTNVAVMDLDDTYVSFTTGLYALFGSGETTTFGYAVDVDPGSRAAPCTRLPIIITDSSAICGRRLAFGANNMATATQITMDLLVAMDNVTSAIEAPRFHIIDGNVGIEKFHTPLFDDDVMKYLETLSEQIVAVPEPYMSSNVVEKVKDDLNSHSDSRQGGVASRF